MHNELKTSPGSPTPLGLSTGQGTANFSLFAAHAKAVRLGLFTPGSLMPIHIVPLQRTEDHWHIALSPIPEGMLYGYQCDDNGEWLFDPYAKILDASSAWAAPLPMPLLGSIQSPTSFDWEGATHPNIPKEALILYE